MEGVDGEPEDTVGDGPLPAPSHFNFDPATKVRRKSRVNLKKNPMQEAMEEKRRKAAEEEAKRQAGSGERCAPHLPACACVLCVGASPAFACASRCGFLCCDMVDTRVAAMAARMAIFGEVKRPGTLKKDEAAVDASVASAPSPTAASAKPKIDARVKNLTKGAGHRSRFLHRSFSHAHPLTLVSLLCLNHSRCLSVFRSFHRL